VLDTDDAMLLQISKHTKSPSPHWIVAIPVHHASRMHASLEQQCSMLSLLRRTRYARKTEIQHPKTHCDNP